MFHRLLAGDWQSDFLVIPPGHEIAATYDDEIVRVTESAPPNRADGAN